jgi:hypothetical protein
MSISNTTIYKSGPVADPTGELCHKKYPGRNFVKPVNRCIEPGHKPDELGESPNQ